MYTPIYTYINKHVSAYTDITRGSDKQLFYLGYLILCILEKFVTLPLKSSHTSIVYRRPLICSPPGGEVPFLCLMKFHLDLADI